MKIIVNGSEHAVEGPKVSYETIIGLAKEGPQAYVKYNAPDGGIGRGTLAPCESVFIEDGMNFRTVTLGNG